VSLALRPEDLRIAETAGPLALVKGRQVSARFVGGVYVQTVKLSGDRELMARGRTQGYPDRDVWVETEPQSIRLLRQ
jgi:hypothetical protein